jgi:propionyl-CoA synthetase
MQSHSYLFIKIVFIFSLKRIFVAGEHCDHETLKWIQNVIKGKPVYDHWWQTESGRLNYFF